MKTAVGVTSEKLLDDSEALSNLSIERNLGVTSLGNTRSSSGSVEAEFIIVSTKPPKGIAGFMKDIALEMSATTLNPYLTKTNDGRIIKGSGLELLGEYRRETGIGMRVIRSLEIATQKGTVNLPVEELVAFKEADTKAMAAERNEYLAAEQEETRLLSEACVPGAYAMKLNVIYRSRVPYASEGGYLKFSDYFRFYEDGTVLRIGASTLMTTKEAVMGFDKNSGPSSSLYRGRYAVRDCHIEFSKLASSEKVDDLEYKGVIGNNSIKLSIHDPITRWRTIRELEIVRATTR